MTQVRPQGAGRDKFGETWRTLRDYGISDSTYVVLPNASHDARGLPRRRPCDCNATLSPLLLPCVKHPFLWCILVDVVEVIAVPPLELHARELSLSVHLNCYDFN